MVKMSAGLPHETWIALRDAGLMTSAGPSCLPRHKRRSRNRCGYINRLLVFRKTPEVCDEIGKGREQPKAFLQRPCLRIELVQPQELPLLINLQKPPLPVVIHCKINRAETDL